jgi:SulP family sulfate permease
MVAGPTNAVAILLAASLTHLAPAGSPDYIRLVIAVTLLTGIFELAMGLARLGTLVNFISHTVIVGFSAGAAILIATSQIKTFFGIAIPAEASFIDTLYQFARQIRDINPWVTATGLFTLVAGIVARRYVPKIPFMISATIAGSVFGVIIDRVVGEGVAGIRKVGALPARLPPLSLPDVSVDTLTKIAPTALATTILALTLAVSIGRSLGIRSGQRIDSNQEFVGQGISNVVGAFFSSFPSAGSFNRSGANYTAGAKTPLANVYASLFLVAIVLVVAPLAAYLPLASVAAILFLIAWGLVDIGRMKAIYRTSRSESSVMFVTLAAALFLGLQTAIYAGVLLSLMLFLNQAARPGIRDVKPDRRAGTFTFDADTGLPDCPQLKMLRVNGSIFFGAVEHVEDTFQRVDAEKPRQKHLLLVASGINIVDISGAELLAREALRRRKLGGGLYFYFMKDAVVATLQSGRYLRDIGEENVLGPRDDVIGTIYSKLDPGICRECQARIFPQCHVALPGGEPRG